MEVDPDFESAYAEDAAVVPSTRSTRISSWLSGTEEYIPPVLAQKQAVEVADRARVNRVDRMLSAGGGDPAELAVMAAQQGSDSGPDATIGMMEILAERGQEPPPSIASSPRAYQERRAGLQAYIRQRLDENTAETDLYYASRQSLIVGQAALSSLPGLLGLAGGAATAIGGDKARSLAAKAVDFAKTAVPEIFIPETQYHVIQIMKKWAPDREWGDLFDKREVFAAAATAIQALAPDEQRIAVDEIISAAEESSGWFSGNVSNKQRMVRDMLGVIAEGGAVGNVDALFHALSFIGPVDVAVGTAGVGLRVATAGVRLATDLRLASQAGSTGLREASLGVRALEAKRPVAPPVEAPAPIVLGPSTIREQAKTFGGLVTEDKGLPILASGAIPTKLALRTRLAEVRSQLDQLPSSEAKLDEGLASQRKGLTNELESIQKTLADLKSGAVREGQARFTVTRAGGDKVFTVQALVNGRIFVASAPAISPGSVADAATLTTQGAKAAVSLALQGDAGAGALAARGTQAADVVGSLIVPKIPGARIDTAAPQISPILFSVEAAEETAARIAAGLTGSPLTRLKDTVINHTETGLEYLSTVGRADGRGFDTVEAAAKVADEVFGPSNYTLTASDDLGQVFIQVRGKDPVPSGNPDKDWVERGAYWKRWLSVQSAFTQSFQTLRIAAQRQSDLGEQAARGVLEPIRKLGAGQRSSVYKLIDDGDRTRTWFGRTAAEQALNQDQKAVDAYMAYKNFAFKNHALANNNLREYMLREGAFDGQVAGVWVPMRKVDGNPATDTFVDSITGTVVAGWKSGDQVFKLYSPIKSSNYVIRRAKAGAQPSRALPARVLYFPDGYVLRSNSFSHYVIDEEGQALFGARSELEASRKMQEIVQLNPTREVTYRLAQEVQRGSTVEGNIQNLLSQGLFYHQRARRANILTGVDGVERVTGVEEGIERMVQQFSTNSGLGSWADEVVREAKSLVSGIRDIEIGVGVRRIPDNLEALELARVDGAQRLVEWVETMQGVSSIQIAKAIRDTIVPVGNSVLDVAQRLSDVAPYQPISPAARWIAENMIGVTDNALSTARKVGFYTLLPLSIFRNWYIQGFSMLPLYAGLRGGYKYLFNPAGYAMDAPLLALSAIAGRAAPGASKLWKLWRDTGLEQSSRANPLIMSTVGSGRYGQSLLGSGARATASAITKYGFTAPVTFDRMNGFLFSLQKWRSLTGKKWPDTSEEVDAVRLLSDTNSLDPTVSGALAIEKGGLGVAMQLLSFTTKTFARPFQKDLSPLERVRMGIHQLAFYGASGVGAATLFDKQFPDAAPAVREAFIGGINDLVLNAVVGAWAGDEGSGINASSNVSPFSAIARISDLTATIVKAFATGGMSGILDSPSASVLGRFVSAAEMGKWLALDVEAPIGAKGQAFMTEMLRVFPLGNALIRSYVAYGTGVLIDNKGSPYTAAGDRGFMAALFQMPTYAEQEIRELGEMGYKDYNDSDDLAIYEKWGDQARENAVKLAKLIEAAGGEDELSANEASRLVYGHAVLAKGLLRETEVVAYHSALMRAMDKLGVFTDEKYRKGLVNAARLGKLRNEPENIALLAANKTPGAQQVLDFWREQEEASRTFDANFEGAK